MKIELNTFDGVDIVRLIGIIDTSTSPEVEKKIQEMLDQGSQKIIIDLKDTEYMSSSGLRILLSTAKKLWAKDGKFRICEPNKVVKDILDTSGFSVILDVKSSKEEALLDF
jgi:anti-sigma B factor antagonist